VLPPSPDALDDLPVSLARPDLEPLLAELALLVDPLARASAARRALGPELGRRAAELAALRARARERFPDGALRHLTPKGLEQATRPEVAALRATRLAAALAAAGKPLRALDPTCGLGSDALAAARAGFEVHLGDRDAVTLACARGNLADAGYTPRSVVHADARALAWRAELVADAALVLDPDRRPRLGPGARTGGAARAREADPSDWSPSLAECLALARRAAAACIKAAPATDASDLPLAAGEVEATWISHRGELVEVALWTGAAARSGAAREVAVLVAKEGAIEVVRSAADPVEVAALPREHASQIAWLVEPDAAVIRAGLVGHVARAAGLAPLAPRIAYLGGDSPGPRGLTRSWPVLGAAPLDPKRVRRMLGALDIGPITVKKRGHPDAAEVLARRLAGPGTQHGLVAVVRLDIGHLALALGPEVAGMSRPHGV
jgi:hypothetical protein